MATRQISVRLDDEHLAAIEAIAAEEAVGTSDAIRIAVMEGHRARRRQRLREEALAIAADEQDVAEVRAAGEALDHISAW